MSDIPDNLKVGIVNDKWMADRIHDLQSQLIDSQARVKELDEKIVYGFYEDRVPVFIQGSKGTNELCSPITADECTGMVTKLLWYEARVKELEGENERLLDLVRYQRGPLFDTELITREEYESLLQIQGSVSRLHGYDRIREDLKAIYEQRISFLESLLEEIKKEALPMGYDWGNSKIAAIAARAFNKQT